MISYLRVIANPDDDVNLLRIVNTPRRGIGKTTLEKLNAISRSHNSSLRTAMELVRTGASLEAEGGGDAVDGAGGLAFGGLSEKAIADIGGLPRPRGGVPRGAPGQEEDLGQGAPARRRGGLLGLPRRGEQAERQGRQVEVPQPRDTHQVHRGLGEQSRQPLAGHLRVAQPCVAHHARRPRGRGGRGRSTS